MSPTSYRAAPPRGDPRTLPARFHRVKRRLAPRPGVARSDAVDSLTDSGLAILTIALIDEFFITATRGRPTYRGVEEQIALGREG